MSTIELNINSLMKYGAIIRMRNWEGRGRKRP
jgi:hypothetical protein